MLWCGCLAVKAPSRFELKPRSEHPWRANCQNVPNAADHHWAGACALSEHSATIRTWRTGTPALGDRGSAQGVVISCTVHRNSAATPGVTFGLQTRTGALGCVCFPLALKQLTVQLFEGPASPFMADSHRTARISES